MHAQGGESRSAPCFSTIVGQGCGEKRMERTYLRHRLRADFDTGDTHERNSQVSDEGIFGDELDTHAHGSDDFFDLDPDGCASHD